MLTGDKLSTAKQIALSCNLISSDTDTTILYINSSEHSIRECLAGHLNALIEKEMHYERAYGVDIYDRRGSRLSDSVYDFFFELTSFGLTFSEEICIIIEGKDLQVALDECAELFYQVWRHFFHFYFYSFSFPGCDEGQDSHLLSSDSTTEVASRETREEQR